MIRGFVARGLVLASLVFVVSLPRPAATAPAAAEPDAELDSGAELTRARIEDLESRLGEPAGRLEPRACRFNAEGVCVFRHDYRRRRKKLRSGEPEPLPPLEPRPGRSLDPELQVLRDSLIRSCETLVANPRADTLPERDPCLYRLAALYVERQEPERALPHLERLLARDDGGERSVWAAELLLDVLLRRWDYPPPPGLDPISPLDRWHARLPTMPLWRHPLAEERLKPLRVAIDQGLRWRVGMHYLEAGRATAKRTGWANLDQQAVDNFTRCAETFLELHDDYGARHEKADTLLWNASSCYDAAYEVELAMATRRQLLARYPDSEHYKNTLAYLAGNLEALGRYGESAPLREAFAARYVKDERAADMLYNAYRFRLELGQTSQARTNLEGYVELFKKKNPKKAARAFWVLGELETQDAGQVEHAEAYLRAFSKAGGSALRIVAEARLGELGWRGSCRRGDVTGLCAIVAPRPSAALTLAGPRGQPRRYRPPMIQVHLRELGADNSLRRFVLVSKLLRQKTRIPPEDRQLVQAYRDAVGAALAYTTDAYFEELARQVDRVTSASLAELRSPRGDFPTPSRADALVLSETQRAAVGASKELMAAVERLELRYRALAALPFSTPWRTVARARAGLLREWLLGQLVVEARGRPLPPDVVETLTTSARARYERCLQPEEGSWEPAAAAFCQARLLALAPDSALLVRERVLMNKTCETCQLDAPALAQVEGVVLEPPLAASEDDAD